MANYRNEGRVAILTLTVMAAADVLQRRAVTKDGSYPAAGSHMYGTTFVDGKSGCELAVDCLGQVPMTAGAAIPEDSLVEVGTDGKFIPLNTGKPVARAITAASGDDATFQGFILPATS